MNPIVKRVGTAVLGFSALLATAIAFQNCSGYQFYDVTESNLSSVCGDPSCAQSVSGLNLETMRSLAIYEPDLDSSRRIDIAGYCDDAEFPNSRIQYRFFNGGNALENEWVSAGSCDELGRFHIQPVVPSVSGGAGLVQGFTLRVRLAIPIDQTTFLSSFPAEKQISISVQKQL